MKKGDTVIAPDKCQRWLTPGKAYPIVRVYENNQFSIRDDEDNLIYTNLIGSAHLNFGDWIITKQEHNEEERAI
jgi:hypothetical protein